MPLQNRVTPLGDVVAAPWRGAFMGNRGCLHGPDRTLGVARWRHKSWVCCLLDFQGRKREPMPMPGAPTVYTALFFWDEAAAFAAGHRPCAECRYLDYRRFTAHWTEAGLPGKQAREIDAKLHESRVTRKREQIRTEAPLADLPKGTFLLVNGQPILLSEQGPMIWREGYRPFQGVLPQTVQVLTPAPVVETFRAGYVPAMRL